LKNNKQNNMSSRRNFLKNTLGGIVATTVADKAFGMPTIVPASVFGPYSPSNRINVAALGTGRISREHDMKETLKYNNARIMAVCDLDSLRAESARKFVNDAYSKSEGKPYDGVKVYTDYREVLANKDVDAVIISTPDHWHAIMGIHAVEAGKDVYSQKPTALTIAEGRALSNAVHRSGQVFQMGSQQRSQNPWPHFHRACELVRNGRLGDIKTIYVGLPGDPGGDSEPEMPIPKTFNYEMWLGSTPYKYYTEKRVHPQNDFSRPGWLRCEQFGAGMITGWGSHHIDTAHWAMGWEHTGPVEISGVSEFPKSGLWDVHGIFKTEALYANGTKMVVSNEIPNGIKFEGTEGWLFVTRGNGGATASDPVKNTGNTEVLSASNPKILSSVIGENEVHLYRSPEQHGNWLDCIKSRQATVAPVEVAHRSTSACLLHHIAMKLKRKVYWEPAKERFKNDDEANRLLSRSMRAPYLIE
jgi:predicted dehydrogenase